MAKPALAMDTTKYEIGAVYMIAIDEIEGAEFQPRNRADERRLAELESAIEATGGELLNPVLLSAIDGRIGDGHRRVAVLRRRGATHVPAKFLNLTSGEIFSAANKGTDPVKGQHWAEAVSLGLEMGLVRRGQRPLIQAWIDALGPEDFAEMAARRSTDIVTVAKSVLRHLGKSRDDMAALRSILLWLDKHNMARPFIDARRNGVSPQAIERAIAEDRPLRQFWA